MPKSKPLGWPRYMVAKRLAGGVVAYYWAPPSWAIKGGCELGSVALGSSYGQAKDRCDRELNVQFDVWRSGGSDVPPTSSQRGTFDWLVATYKLSTQYTNLQLGTRTDYDRALNDVSKLPTKDGKRRMGEMLISSITPAVADKIYDRLKRQQDGSLRARSALAAITCAKLAWKVARRAEPDTVPSDNPFRGVEMDYEAATTRPATHEELVKFVAAADKRGERSIGTAAMIAYYWLMRQVDILGRFAWTHYRPDGLQIVRVWHHKTRELVELPLLDEEGSALWPELTERLDNTERRGTLVVTRDRQDHWKKAYLPWREDYFRHVVAEIREDAKIDTAVKFMGLRHGGNTEGANAGLTEAQLRALSGHTSSSLYRYAQETKEQRIAGAKKRRDARRKK